MISQPVIRTWAILTLIAIFCGLLDHFFNALGGATSVMLYVSIGILGKIGLPVWQAHSEGWGWLTPNTFGYFAGMIAWLLVFYGMAIIHVKDRETHEDLPTKETDKKF